jgi:hypothetical protein
MAQQVDGKSLMRRETSLGLAKALHEDFGVHDGTPSRDAPSPLMKKLGLEEAEEARKHDEDEVYNGILEVDGQIQRLNLEKREKNEDNNSVGNGGGSGQLGTPLPRNHNNNTSSHVPSSTPPSATSIQQQPWSAQGLSQDKSAIVSPGAAGASAGGSSGLLSDPPMQRNMSFESDCHSLGFNAREAIQNLRTQQSGGVASGPSGVGVSFNRQYSIASDLDTTLWETSEEESDGATKTPKVRSMRQPPPPEQRRDCALM